MAKLPVPSAPKSSPAPKPSSSPKQAPTPSPSPAPAPKPPTVSSANQQKKVVEETRKNITTQLKAKEEAKATQLAQVKVTDEGQRARARDEALRRQAESAAKEDLRRISSRQPGTQPPPKITTTTKPGGKIPPKYRGPGDPAPEFPVRQIPIPVDERPVVPPSPGDQTTFDNVDTPFFPSYSPAASIPRQTLSPGRDVINFQTEQVSVEAMEQILFEQIGGYELINLVRRDTVEGQNPFYTLISNLSSIRRQLDPAQIISLQQPNRTGFEIYEINLDERIPGDQYLQSNNISNFFYIDDNGDLVIELENMQDDEEIEVQMANSGKIT